MKFKIDENLPIECVQILRESGFDADTVYDEVVHIIGTELLEGCTWIVDEKRIRIRGGPGWS